MRSFRAIVVLVFGVVLAIPLEAGADGGAIIQFDETHYQPGDAVTGGGWIYVPENKQFLLDRGPFYALLVPGGPAIQEGRPLPEGVIRLAQVGFEPYRKTEFELHVSFTMPDVEGAYYTVAICNDPCTISGFREPLNGPISVVHTEREAKLLNENSRLQFAAYNLRRKLQKAERSAIELEDTLDVSRDQALALSAQIGRLELELQLEAANGQLALEPATAIDDRPLVEAWALFGLGIALIVALLTLALALVLSRRTAPRVVVPDTIAELDELARQGEPEPAARRSVPM
ncbi:MAG TPA: hypothetical protein VJO36_01385 [Actinomycetota bacterium]|nr:hypothetical protein [Actinomycetota bacterium]